MLNDDIIKKTDKVHFAARPKQKWIKWGVMAACLCIVIFGIMTIGQRFETRSFDYAESPALVSLDEGPEIEKEGFAGAWSAKRSAEGQAARTQRFDDPWYSHDAAQRPRQSS